MLRKPLKLNFTSLFISFIQTNLHVGKKVETRDIIKTKGKKKYKFKNLPRCMASHAFFFFFSFLSFTYTFLKLCD